MEQGGTTKSNGLEDQLRHMILGNVTIASDQANRDNRSTHRGRGRGRGYGSVTRGFDRNHHSNAEPNQSWRAIAAAEMASHRGRGHSHTSYAPGQRYQRPHVDTQTQQHSGPPQDGPPETARRQYASRPVGQPRYEQRAVKDRSLDGKQPLKVLQRPQSTAVSQSQGSTNTPTQYQPRLQGPYQSRANPQYPQENPMAQSEHLERIAMQEVPKVELSIAELDEKEAFRKQLETHLQKALTEGYTGDIATISLVGFGSLSSGFAMPGSDMDLAVVPAWKDPSKADQVSIDRHIPRLLERAILDLKMGGRLLTRTRVPILKVCQTPTETLYHALLEERQKWDDLSEEEKYPSEISAEPVSQSKILVETGGVKSSELTHHADHPSLDTDFPGLGTVKHKKKVARSSNDTPQQKDNSQTSGGKPDEVTANGVNITSNKEQQPRSEKQWVREKVLGPLDFPKTGCGIQCDINFGNPLGIHNTHMLRCYSLTDPRVRPIVLFVKSWAKRRKVNSSYSGTLSSYGWVLMVLHYLVNVTQPPVCPNLQHSIPQPTDLGELEQFFKETTVSGYNVRFWRNEQEIMQAAQSRRLSHNQQSIGELLRGFFQYYAGIGGYNYGPRPPQFYWTTEVLSLRTPGGIITKQSKGWVSATTKITAEKKVTNRYLFAIEDPFEIDHNVARTVTHKGIVAIRDEFRRAWRILRAIGQGQQPEGGIFDEVIEEPPAPVATQEDTKELQKGTRKSLGTDDVVAIPASDKPSVV